jgi:hypothetical protein
MVNNEDIFINRRFLVVEVGTVAKMLGALPRWMAMLIRWIRYAHDLGSPVVLSIRRFPKSLTRARASSQLATCNLHKSLHCWMMNHSTTPIIINFALCTYLHMYVNYVYTNIELWESEGWQCVPSDLPPDALLWHEHVQARLGRESTFPHDKDLPRPRGGHHCSNFPGGSFRLFFGCG